MDISAELVRVADMVEAALLFDDPNPPTKRCPKCGRNIDYEPHTMTYRCKHCHYFERGKSRVSGEKRIAAADESFDPEWEMRQYERSGSPLSKKVDALTNRLGKFVAEVEKIGDDTEKFQTAFENLSGRVAILLKYMDEFGDPQLKQLQSEISNAFRELRVFSASLSGDCTDLNRFSNDWDKQIELVGGQLFKDRSQRDYFRLEGLLNQLLSDEYHNVPYAFSFSLGLRGESALKDLKEMSKLAPEMRDALTGEKYKRRLTTEFWQALRGYSKSIETAYGLLLDLVDRALRLGNKGKGLRDEIMDFNY